MDEARRIVNAGFVGAGIVRADTQTAGRGRIAGRHWIDAPGRSLLITIILPEGSAAVQALPLRVGLGVARALEAAEATETTHAGAPPKFWLKWPNDVVAVWRAPDRKATPGRAGTFNRAAARERADTPGRAQAQSSYGKICGILCETVGGRALAGIGINVKRAALPIGLPMELPAEHPMGLHAELFEGSPATTAPFPPLSLEEALGELPLSWHDLESAARTLASAVLESLDDRRWKGEYEARLWGLGERLRFLAGHPEHPEIVEGICEGVGDDGSLILNIEGNRRAFASGEISSRRG